MVSQSHQSTSSSSKIAEYPSQLSSVILEYGEVLASNYEALRPQRMAEREAHQKFVSLDESDFFSSPAEFIATFESSLEALNQIPRNSKFNEVTVDAEVKAYGQLRSTLSSDVNSITSDELSGVAKATNSIASLNLVAATLEKAEATAVESGSASKAVLIFREALNLAVQELGTNHNLVKAINRSLSDLGYTV